jgi:hypothetical protein
VYRTLEYPQKFGPPNTYFYGCCTKQNFVELPIGMLDEIARRRKCWFFRGGEKEDPIRMHDEKKCGWSNYSHMPAAARPFASFLVFPLFFCCHGKEMEIEVFEFFRVRACACVCGPVASPKGDCFQFKDACVEEKSFFGLHFSAIQKGFDKGKKADLRAL